MLTREQILAAEDRPTETFPVPQWGGEVTIRMMDGVQRELCEDYNSDAKRKNLKMGHVRAAYAAYSVIDESGNLTFTPADIPALAKKSGAALDVIFAHVVKLNGMSKEEAGEIAKN